MPLVTSVSGSRQLMIEVSVPVSGLDICFEAASIGFDVPLSCFIQVQSQL